nr:helix-turn-helix domain-containing protein [Halovenus aranensis]
MLIRAETEICSTLVQNAKTDETVQNSELVGHDLLLTQYASGIGEVQTQRTVVDVGATIVEAVTSGSGWHLTMIFPTVRDYRTLVEECRRNGMCVETQYILTSEQESDAVAALTEKQRQLLSLARQNGYFAIPRECTLQQIADKMGVTQQAVSQLLRRALSNVTDYYLQRQP